MAKLSSRWFAGTFVSKSKDMFLEKFLRNIVQHRAVSVTFIFLLASLKAVRGAKGGTAIDS